PAVDPRVPPLAAGKRPDLPRGVVERRLAARRPSADDRHFPFRSVHDQPHAPDPLITAGERPSAPGAPPPAGAPAPPGLGRLPVIAVEDIDPGQHGPLRDLQGGL